MPDWSDYCRYPPLPVFVGTVRPRSSLESLPWVTNDTGHLLVNLHLADRIMSRQNISDRWLDSETWHISWKDHVYASRSELSARDYATYERLFLQVFLCTRLDSARILNWSALSKALVGPVDSHEYRPTQSERDEMLQPLENSALMGQGEQLNFSIGDPELYHHGRLLFKTRNGHIGLGSEELKEDDIIAYLDTVTEPVALRLEYGRWYFVGCVFVPGMPQNPGFYDTSLEIG